MEMNKFFKKLLPPREEVLDISVTTNKDGQLVLRFNENYSFSKEDEIRMNLIITIDTLKPNQSIMHLTNDNIE